MKIKVPGGWIWNTYFLCYILFAGANLFFFFLPQSPVARYYHIALAFNTYFFGTYVLELTSRLLNALCILPLFLYIHRIRFLTPSFWAWFFVLRLAFDLTGHNYEMNLVKSVWHDDSALGVRVILTYVFLSLPSYLALWEYAFGNIFDKKDIANSR